MATGGAAATLTSGGGPLAGTSGSVGGRSRTREAAPARLGLGRRLPPCGGSRPAHPQRPPPWPRLTSEVSACAASASGTWACGASAWTAPVDGDAASDPNTKSSSSDCDGWTWASETTGASAGTSTAASAADGWPCLASASSPATSDSHFGSGCLHVRCGRDGVARLRGIDLGRRLLRLGSGRGDLGGGDLGRDVLDGARGFGQVDVRVGVDLDVDDGGGNVDDDRRRHVAPDTTVHDRFRCRFEHLAHGGDITLVSGILPGAPGAVDAAVDLGGPLLGRLRR